MQKNNSRIKQKIKKYLYLLLGILIYTTLHELAHYFMALSLGIPGKININLIQPYFTPLDPKNIPLTSYYLILLAPYLLDTLILTTISLKPKKLSKFAIFPLINTFGNLPASFIGDPGDFKLLLILAQKTTYKIILPIIFILILDLLLIAKIYFLKEIRIITISHRKQNQNI